MEQFTECLRITRLRENGNYFVGFKLDDTDGRTAAKKVR